MKTKRRSHLVAENIANIVEYESRIKNINDTVRWLKWSDPAAAENLLGYITVFTKLINTLRDEIDEYQKIGSPRIVELPMKGEKK